MSNSKKTVRIQAKNPVKPRNYLALNPLMQKGGVHESDDVAIARKRARRSCKQTLVQTDWLSEIDDWQSETDLSTLDHSQLELDRL